MTSAAREAFATLYREAQRRSQGVGAIDIARMANEAGMSPQEAIRELRSANPYSRESHSDVYDALVAFAAKLRRPGGSSLEYSRQPSLVTAANADQEQSLAYVMPDQQLSEALQVIFTDRRASVVSSIRDISSDTQFDLIVCQPALGHQPSGDDRADGFGGDVMQDLVPLLAKSGTLLWITARGALFLPKPQQTFMALQQRGLHKIGVIDLPPGVFPGTNIEGAAIILGIEKPGKNFVGVLRDTETASAMAQAHFSRNMNKAGPTWAWLELSDHRTFGQVEHDRLRQRLMPRGSHSSRSLRSLLSHERVEKADKLATDEAGSYVFIPEYAGSRVTTDLDEQTVKPKAVYRFAVDPSKVNPRFLAQLLNGPYGRELRASAAQGMTIQRTSSATLLSLELPVPDIATQDRIARIDSDIKLLTASFRDLQSDLEQNWTALADVADKIERMKAVVDIERQIADWWRELPYPLATVYRRYQVAQQPKERLDTLLHFFELSAVYLASVGTSHVKAMRQNWQETLSKWLHPTGGAGVERADFGFWIGLATASLKDINRIASDKELRAAAVEVAGPELLQVATTVGSLARATEVLDVPRRYRNSFKGHGGLIKDSDAERLDVELQQSVRDFYEATASVFRRLKLVRPGMAEFTDSGVKFETEILSGSDPTFEKKRIELDRPAKSKALAFWLQDARTACRALPFIRLGAPKEPRENCVYIFNRVENGGLRWVSYQEAQEQAIIAADDELTGLISLGRGSR